MKILDRYILSSITGAFLFGISLFMGLLLAMDLMRKMVELIVDQHVPVMIALKIFAYRVPSMLSYAFPMSVLLAILLVFNRMSSESEMTAIRAAGVSFTRLIIPAIVVSILVAVLAFVISDNFAPFAGKRARDLLLEAKKETLEDQAVQLVHKEKNNILYTLTASSLELSNPPVMKRVVMVLYKGGVPTYYCYAARAEYIVDMTADGRPEARWIFHSPAKMTTVAPGASGPLIELTDPNAVSDLSAFAAKLQENPFDLSAGKKYPEEFTARELKILVQHLNVLNVDNVDSGVNKDLYGRMIMGLQARFATPFTCIVFALIAAPLGLRHHRSSSTVGLGISLLVIFAYYFVSVYTNTFGESGQMPAWLAAWMPNILGTVVGLVLIYRANK